MIIGTCGFCSTGSSAVSDYLKEFNENQVLDKLEFAMTYLPDGLEDLDYHLNKNINRDDNCGISIPRFRRFMRTYEHMLSKCSGMPEKKIRMKTEEYLDSLIQMKWKSIRRSDVLLYPTWFYYNFGVRFMTQFFSPLLGKILGKKLLLYPNRTLDVCIHPKDFLSKSQALVRWYLEGFGADYTKNIVLDQSFIGNDPAKSFKFFGEAIAIVVDRDPRDNYIFTKEYLSKRGGFMPSDSVEEFVNYYRLLRDNMPYKNPDKRILLLNFEDMVYDYDNTTKKIRDFCNLPDNPRPFSVFDPKLSVNNTQLILKFPQYKHDVEYIERELSEYLFNFERFPKPNNTGKMFMGKSPLNK